jgi:NAD(P)-dependent dehydrogenase (short-subunit alcohol dehydrogenase family)
VESGLGEGIARACAGAGMQLVIADADAAWKQFGGCHLLCNNAGVIVQGPLPEMTDADWGWVLDVNLRGVVNGVRPSYRDSSPSASRPTS